MTWSKGAQAAQEKSRAPGKAPEHMPGRKAASPAEIRGTDLEPEPGVSAGGVLPGKTGARRDRRQLQRSPWDAWLPLAALRGH